MAHSDPEAKKAYDRAYYQRHRERLRPGAAKRQRTYYQRHRKRILEGLRDDYADPTSKRRQYLEATAERQKEYKRAHYLQHRERYLAEQRRRRQTPGPERERYLAWGHGYRAANRDQLREEYRQWRLRHPERCREKSQLRRLRTLGGSGILARDWLRLVARHGGHCAYCGDAATEQDHVIPLARGGRHTIGNVLPACGFCNRSKKDRLLVEWPRRPTF